MEKKASAEKAVREIVDRYPDERWARFAAERLREMTGSPAF
jgi:hypothetical protein